MAVFTAMAVSAAVSSLMQGMSGASQSLNEAQLIKSQNAARIKRLNAQFQNDTQNMFNNQESILQQKFKNDVVIEESKLAAQDAFAQAFAGSGVKGRSVDALEAQINNDVAEAHNENQAQAKFQRDRMFLGIMRQADANKQEIDNLIGFDAGAAKAANDMATLSAGVQAGVSAWQSGGSPTTSKGFGFK
jgi:hypothetical protein